MKTNFYPNSVATNTKTLASYLPIGKLYDAKNDINTMFYKLLYSFSGEYTRVQEKINELSVEYDMQQTMELIEYWERALGIPDDCFTNTVDITQRQLQCVIKFAQMNVQTEADFIQLAATLGYAIEIIHGSGDMATSIFPMVFPFVFVWSAFEARFTMIIKFLDINKPQNVFPMIFPFIFQEGNVLECVFSYLKPANVNLIFWYADYP